MYDEYDMFQQAIGAFIAEELEEETKEIRKDYCYDCQSDEGYWVMMALRCKGCDKILIGD